MIDSLRKKAEGLKELKKRLTRYLYVLSFDGLSTLDFPYIQTLPHFNEFLDKASYCRNVVSIYPTLTYPAHVTIMTGRYPKKHGVINNTLLQPNRKSPDWYWHRRRISGQPLFELASTHGMKVAALLWPVTAKAKIQYNLPEIFKNRPWQSQILVSLFNGSPWFQWVLNYKFGKLRRGLWQPFLDDFVQKSLLYTVKQKNPDLTLAHFTDLDSMRHEHGFHSEDARQALERLDQKLGELIQALRDNGTYEQSTIIVLGDHAHLDGDKIVKLNVFLHDKGFLDLDVKGRVAAYQAIAKSCDGSCYIYVNSRVQSSEALRSLHQVLRKALEKFNREHHCFESIYSQEEARDLGADPTCAFMLEANKGYYFLDSLEGEVLSQVLPEQIGVLPHYMQATHGYSPFKEDYTTVFLAAGEGIKEGIIVEQMNLIDEGPTLAKLLGLSLEETDGRCVDEILKAPEGLKPKTENE